MAERVRPSSRFPGLLVSNLEITDTQLGVGSDATVFEVNWNGTVCAAKRLHHILLQDQSPDGAEKLISNFEAECITWSKLRHPGVVQFLGVYLERNTRLPVLVIEKMDISLWRFLEDHSKEEFSLHLKAFVLLQTCQALAYLHGQNPPLVHHDLSPNNVLLNIVSFVAKLTDFGMSRAISPSTLSRKSSIKGTPAFMSPEALHDPPRYNEKLDVFSFGNVILSTLTHEWPNPGPPTRYEGDVFVAITELQRRERYVEMFTAQEKQLFLPAVRQCLENRPDKRPSSAVLVRELRHIESSLPSGGHVAAPIEQLWQQLSAKEDECRQKDEELREKVATIAGQQDIIQEQRFLNQAQRTAIQQHLGTIRVRQAALHKKDATIKRQQDTIREQQDTIQTQQSEIERLRKQPAVAQQVKHLPRDWRKLGECRKVIQHSPEGGMYRAIAVNSEGLLAVTDGFNKCVHLLTNNGTLVRSIGKGLLGGSLYGVSFDLRNNVWVTDSSNNKIVKLSQDGRLLQTIRHETSKSDRSNKHTGVSVSPEGLVYICNNVNHRVTVHDEEGSFLFSFGLVGFDPESFDGLRDIAFGSDGLVYVVDQGDKRICAWSKEGTYRRDIKINYDPDYIAATSDNHLLITSFNSSVVMVYTFEGELIHQFGALKSDPGRFNPGICNRPWGICVDDNGLVYVVDGWNKRVQVF